jgi:predicted pyridoxine 5'-phosphate oxidase superfamily flavin-nucleotide-binding protein
VALLFVIPGSNTTLRINGKAVISVESSLLERLAYEGKLPRSAIVITLDEVYFQCARALMRARLWEPAAWPDRSALPSPGRLMQELDRDFDGASYDALWSERAKTSMW